MTSLREAVLPALSSIVLLACAGAPLDRPDLAAAADLGGGGELGASRDLGTAFDLSTRGDLPAADLSRPPDLARPPDLSMPGPRFCGGIAGLPCPDGQFCDIAMNCGAADEGGTCRPKPQACPDIYSPVCGCDDREYGNDCERQGAGVSKKHDGICGCLKACAPGSRCMMCHNGPACVPNGAAC